MQAHAEHQENDADFRELTRKIGVADKSGCEGAKCDARKEIANNWWKTQPMGQQATKECEHQTHGDRGDQRSVVRHLPPGDRCSRSSSKELASIIWCIAFGHSE